MRFLLRVLGTWALGLALILVIKDIAISITSLTISLSSFAQTWQGLHKASWSGFSNYILDLFDIISAQYIAQFIFNFPAWIILSLLGIILLLLGRKKKTSAFIKSGWR